ncbi:inositol monophosphatase family protein [Rhizosphaericola mali]|uniref:Inositol monophosphatase family protein n=1 Tax=Rhizosphaericola mali TaxID=2545455 RepID=A0A5P2G625_9BACT|nr:inositol monophosphatase family protein [Rhizosphaericola mali]QES89669.1 inositol monophosphatase family protein [Rhizosphaericola mali]
MQIATSADIAIEAVKNVGRYFLGEFRKAPVPTTPNDLMKTLTIIEEICLSMLKKDIDTEYGNIPWASDDEFDNNSQLAPAPYECYWLCDTMDGAIQYLQHIPGWTINLVLIEKGEPAFSIIYDPLTDECFHAEKYQGAYLNGRPIVVSEKKSAENMIAILEYGHQLKSSNKWEKDLSSALIRLTERFGVVRNYGPHGLQLAYIGAGRIDLFAQCDLDTHNWLAGILIAKEAGATILASDGKAWKWGDESIIVGTSEAVAINFQK